MFLFLSALALLLLSFSYQRQPDNLLDRVPNFSLKILLNKWPFVAMTSLFLVLHFIIPQKWKPVFELSRIGMEHGLWFQIFSHGLLHHDSNHLIGNLFGLVVLSGFWQMVRPIHVLFVFTLGVALSGLLSLLTHDGLLVGASGGIFAIAGIFIANFRNFENKQQFGMALVSIVLFYIVVNFASYEKDQQINHFAHATGFAIGIAYGLGRSHRVSPGP